MTKNHNNATVSWVLFVLVASLNIISHICVEGKQVSKGSNFRLRPKGTIKSIEVPEDGDIIDCVLFHKQPAFDDPLIKHSLVTVASPKLPFSKKSPKLRQSWHKYGECPKGTVPIRRTRHSDIIRRKIDGPPDPPPEPVSRSEEYAQVNTRKGNTYQGAGAVINVWKPDVVSYYEYSTAQITVQTDTEFTNLVEAGWRVDPARYNDDQPKLFTRWANDDEGCYDLDCPYFVQTNNQYALGVTLEWSEYNQSVADAFFLISKFNQSGDWHFQFDGVDLGYWPSIKIPALADHADILVWGGFVLNTLPDNHHTATQMGNGHFPSEGANRAASIHHIQVLNKDFVLEQAKDLETDSSWKDCYDVAIGPEGTEYDTHIYYGGSGFSPLCPDTY